MDYQDVDCKELIDKLKDFLLTENLTPITSQTRLNRALYEVIKTMDDYDVKDLIRAELSGYKAIKEYVAWYRYLSLDVLDVNDLKVRRLWDESLLTVSKE